MKIILKKYICAALNLVFFVTGPAPLLCLSSHTYGRCSRRSAFFAWLFGCTCAVFCEGVSRHVTYAGYFAPKAIEILFNSLEHHKIIKQTERKGLIIFILASAMLGLAASRGHCNKKRFYQKVVQEVLEEDNKGHKQLTHQISR